MSKMPFNDLIDKLRQISYTEFTENFGNIDRDVVAMLQSKNAKAVRLLLRKRVESGQLFDGKLAQLHKAEFGILERAPELIKGEVAAIDGACVLPLQQYSIGQAVCVAVGNVSHTKNLENTLQYWSTRVELDHVKREEDFFKIQHDFLYGISQTAVLRFLETRHAIELNEPYIFLDGPIVYEWLAGHNIGCDLYTELFEKKQTIGVIKNLGSSKKLAAYGSVLRSGELFVLETLADHLEEHHRGGRAHTAGHFIDRVAPNVYRGVFKPALTPYGFEVHKDHFETMIRLMAADCEMTHIGHETPYLLNLVDKELRAYCPVELLKNQIAFSMQKEREELFFENMDEFEFR